MAVAEIRPPKNEEENPPPSSGKNTNLDIEEKLPPRRNV